MSVNKKEIINSIEGVFLQIDRNEAQDIIDHSIEEYLNMVDEYKIDTSQQFHTSKNQFLKSHLNHYIQDSSDYVPIDSDIDRSPVSSRGVLGVTIFDSYHAMNEGWDRMESLNSMNEFKKFQNSLIEEHGLSAGSIPNHELILDSLSSSKYYDHDMLNEGFDDTSLSKFEAVAEYYEEGYHDLLYDHQKEYHAYIMNGADPDVDLDTFEYSDYVSRRMGPGYETAVDMQMGYDRYDYIQAVELDARSTPRELLKNYEQLLYGIYDQDIHSVESSGLKDEFEKSVDEYFELSGFSEIDLYLDEDGNEANSLRVHELLDAVSKNIGIREKDIHETIYKLDQEDKMYLDKGIHFGSRGGTTTSEPGGMENHGKWLMVGYQAIYGQPIDFNADYKREVGHNLDYSNNSLEQMAIDLGVNDVVELSSNDGLFDVELNKQITSEIAPTVSPNNAFESVESLLSQIHNKEEIKETEAMKYFEDNLNHVVSGWGYDVDSLIMDPDTFTDLMAITTNNTINEMDPQANSQNEGYTITTRVLGYDIGVSDVVDFTDGYRLAYDVPFDAVLSTMNDVRREMGQSDIKDIRGELNYYDVFKANNRSEIDSLILQKKSEITSEIQSEVDVMTSDYDRAIENDEFDDWLDF